MGFGGFSATSVFFSDSSFPAMFHAHSLRFVDVGKHVRLNGLWTQIGLFSTKSFLGVTLSSLGTLNFAPGPVSGMRFTSDPSAKTQAFHNFNGMEMNFGSAALAVVIVIPPEPIPEASTVILLGLGTLGLEVVSRRCKRSA